MIYFLLNHVHYYCEFPDYLNYIIENEMQEKYIIIFFCQ